MCHDTFLSYGLDALFLDKSAQGMESSSSFESANSLLVLTFEE
jgi:hypothetical protein